jgi:predicted Zn-dependent peptidase
MSFFAFSVSKASEPVIKTVTLQNGLKVTMIQVKENPVIASILVMKVGLKHENKDINGVSHLLEHLAFNGTGKRTQKQLYDDFDKLGCYNNASTGDHYTGYYILTKKEFFKKAIEVQEDMLFNSVIPENKIEKEKKIVLQEIRKDRMSPYFEKDKIIRNHLFPDSPYGMKVIGDEKSVTNIKRKDIVNFYKKYYSPKNCVALVIGDFEFSNMQKILTNTIGKVERDIKLEKNNTAIHIATTNKVKKYTYNGRTNSFNFFIEGVKCNSKDFVSQEVIATILDNQLKKQFGEKTNHISCSTTYTDDFGYFRIEANLVQGVDENKFYSELKNYISDSFDITKKQVKNVKSTLKSDFLFALERPHFFGMLYAPYLAAGKDNLLFYNEVNYDNVKKYLLKFKKLPLTSAVYLSLKEKMQ